MRERELPVKILTANIRRWEDRASLPQNMYNTLSIMYVHSFSLQANELRAVCECEGGGEAFSRYGIRTA